MKCPCCGSEVIDGQRFCGVCGAAVPDAQRQPVGSSATTSFAEAVAEAVRTQGAVVLSSPGRFVGCVSDLADTDSDEMRVLYGACDESFLGLFAQAAAEGTEGALHDAAARAADHLVHERLIDRRAAASTSEQLAAGIAGALGVAYAPAAQQATSAPVAPTAPPEQLVREVRRGLESARWREPSQRSNPQQASWKQASQLKAAHVQHGVVDHQRGIDQAQRAADERARRAATTQSAGTNKSVRAVAIVAALGVCMIVGLLVLSMINGPKRLSGTTADTGVPTAQSGGVAEIFPTEGTIGDIHYSIENRTWDDMEVTFLFVQNNGNDTVKVVSKGACTSDSIPALGPNDKGILDFVYFEDAPLSGDGDPQDCLTIIPTTDNSPARYLSWQEDNRNSATDELTLTIYNTYGSEWPYDEESFDFVSANHIITVGWKNSDGEVSTSVAANSDGYTYSEYSEAPVFSDGGYDIYINGVRIPRA